MAFKMKAGKEGPMRKNFGKDIAPMNFNAGLRKASREGKLDNNPKFKAAVDNAPMKKEGGKVSAPNGRVGNIPSKPAKKDPMPNAKPKAPSKDKFIGPRNKIVGEGYHKEKKGKIKAVKSKVKRPTTVGDVARGVKNTLKTAGRKIGKTKIRDVGVGIATGNLGGVLARQLLKKEKDSPNKMKKESPKKFLGKAIKGVRNFARKNPGLAGQLIAPGVGGMLAGGLMKMKKAPNKMKKK